MKWTVEMLIEELQNMPADAEVRLAFQKRYPLEYTFGDAVFARDGKVYIGAVSYTHLTLPTKRIV